MIASTWLLATMLLLGVVTTVGLFGPGELSLPVAVGAFIHLGQKNFSDRSSRCTLTLGRRLFRTSMELVLGGSDETWKINGELLEALE